MLNWFVKKLIKRCENKGSYWVITGRPNEKTMKEVPYLVRYFVLRTKYLTIYIHRFLRSDLDTLHDHPWYFMTYLLEGSYKEHTLYGVNNRTAKKNRLVFRTPSDFHKVQVKRTLTFEQRHKAPLTLFVCGPRVKEWGFLDKGKWVPYWKYLKVPKKKNQPWD